MTLRSAPDMKLISFRQNEWQANKSKSQMKDNPTQSSILSNRQRRFLAFVACFGGSLVLACLFAIVIVILNRAFDLFSGVIWSLAVSGMLGILLRPIVTFFEINLKLGRFTSILLLYLLVVSAVGSSTWFLGAKIIKQSREFIGSAADWPERLEEKGKESLPPETWEGISEQVQAFKEYWKNLIGSDNFSPDPNLSLKQKSYYEKLDFDQREIFRSLNSMEKEEFFSLEDENERNSYLVRKDIEMRNQAMETMEKQSGELAEKSAKVLKGAWSGLLVIFAQITYFAVIPIYLFYFLSSVSYTHLTLPTKA